MNRRSFLLQNLMAGGLLSMPTAFKSFFGDIRTTGSGFNPAMVPEPIISDNPEFRKLYYKAWELAFNHINQNQELPQSPYIDEAFDPNTIWIWDTCFMVQFCKYAPDIFPGIQSLNNFYQPIHDGVKIPLRIEILDNPPLFAWTEYEYFKFTNDQPHGKELLFKNQYLQKHFEWFEKVKPGLELANSAPTCLEKTKLGYHWEGGRSGMDNSPRGRTGEHAIKSRPNNPKMLWIDAIAQQGLSALCISRLLAKNADKVGSKEWHKQYQEIKSQVNEHYWDEDDGFYYDLDEETLEPIKVITPASFWPMLAEMCTQKQADKMIQKIKDPSILGGKIPWVSLSRNDPDFSSLGNYWRGSIWLPLAYIGIKAIEKYGYHDLAAKNAAEIIGHMVATYDQFTPHSIWECYNPMEAKPAITEHGDNGLVRKDFCGWSALGPISLLIENVLGFYDIDAESKVIKWHRTRTDRHGIRKLKFGNVSTDLIYQNGKIEASTNEPYTLVVNGRVIKIMNGTHVYT